MKQNETYEVQFSGLKLGKHGFAWKIDRSLFEAFNVDFLHDVRLNCSLELEKKERIMTFTFEIDGDVITDCDRCGEKVKLPIDLVDQLVVRLDEKTDFTDDEVVFLSPAEHTIDVSQFIYEYVITGLPNRKVHEEGECNPEVEAFLEEQEEKGQNETEEDTIDPRWEALKKLKTKD